MARVYMMPPMIFSTKWSILTETIEKILTQNEQPTDKWNELFDNVYSVCVAMPNNFGRELLDHTKLALINHVDKLLRGVRDAGVANILQNYYSHWQKYSLGIKYLHTLYTCVIQHIKNIKRPREIEAMFANMTIGSTGVMEVIEMGNVTWKHHMVSILDNYLINMLLVNITKLRFNESVTTPFSVIRGVIDSFIVCHEFNENYTLKFYKEYFEEPFLKNSKMYFFSESARLKQVDTVSNYLVKVCQILDDEKLISTQFLPDSTYTKVRALWRLHMVVDHLEFLYGEFITILKEERQDDMYKMYKLLLKCNIEMNRLSDIFMEHIKQYGIIVIESLKQEKNIHVHFVEEVLALHEKYKSMVVKAFDDSSCFNDALDKAFTVIINYKLVKEQPSQSPKYLSKYCDDLLKKSRKSIDIDHNLLLSIITIFKYLEDKDVFQKCYQHHLAMRLIFHHSQSLDTEEEMISYLKQASGYEYTRQFHNMITGIKEAEVMGTTFLNETPHYTGDENSDVNFSMCVLKTGVWPLKSSVSDCCLPREIVPCIQNFDQFYKKRFTERKLTWLHNLSQGVLKLNYLPKQYLVTMQTSQMAILLLFEDKRTLNYSKMHELLQITRDVFQKNINCLITSKLLLLDDDNVSLNMAYTNKHTNLRIRAEIQKDDPKEIERNVYSVEDDQRAYLQAAIVRIMKSYRVINHKQLVGEIISQSKKFVPSITLIKKSINNLIEKEYMDRDSNSSDVYRYIA